jgi:4-diphosphocytidyl-2-C-methyl-D-erythritol kinase
MPALCETAYAKINLALHVRLRRDDGYHELETLFAFCDDGDVLSGELADGISLNISGPFGCGLSGADNLVIRTAELMQAHYGVKQGGALRLDKRLPIASGIGGGSADAAATARLLNRLWGIGAADSELEQLLAPLGADIPACVRSRTVYGEGVGADLREISGTEIQGRAVLLVNPLESVATGPVFKAWDGADRGGLNASNPWRAALNGRNDLEAAAISICPTIADVLNLLEQTDADLVRMSGSGATCFALFASDDARDGAQAQTNKACPAYWTMASCLR